MKTQESTAASNLILKHDFALEVGQDEQYSYGDDYAIAIRRVSAMAYEYVMLSLDNTKVNLVLTRTTCGGREHDIKFIVKDSDAVIVNAELLNYSDVVLINFTDAKDVNKHFGVVFRAKPDSGFGVVRVELYSTETGDGTKTIDTSQFIQQGKLS